MPRSGKKTATSLGRVCSRAEGSVSADVAVAVDVQRKREK